MSVWLGMCVWVGVSQRKVWKLHSQDAKLFKWGADMEDHSFEGGYIVVSQVTSVTWSDSIRDNYNCNSAIPVTCKQFTITTFLAKFVYLNLHI